MDLRPMAPNELMQRADLGVTGKVVNIADGRLDLTGQRDTAPGHNLVIGIAVDQTLKGEVKRGDTVYLQVPRPDDRGIDHYAELLPDGTEVAVVAEDITDRELTGPVRNAEAGRPAGSRLYLPAAQAFFLWGGDEMMSVFMDAGEGGDIVPPVETVEDFVKVYG